MQKVDAGFETVREEVDGFHADLHPAEQQRARNGLRMKWVGWALEREGSVGAVDGEVGRRGMDLPASVDARSSCSPQLTSADMSHGTVS
jgi:hypothetical protein